MAPRKKKKHHGRKKMPISQTKTYKKKMKGPVHKQVKARFGKKAFYPSGNIKTSYLKENKQAQQKKFDNHPTATNRRALRQATEAVNFRSKYQVRS